MTESDLLEIAQCRFKEAKLLRTNGYYAGAVYLAGYSIELMLQRHITRCLHWDNFPPSKSIKNTLYKHDLTELLEFSGLKKVVDSDIDLLTDWKTAGAWNSEKRYTKVTDVSEQQCQDALDAMRSILNFISKQP
jgi:hypothetical protein